MSQAANRWQGSVIMDFAHQITNPNRNDLPSQGSIARTFRRKKVVFTRNSQNQIAIAGDGHFHILTVLC